MILAVLAATVLMVGSSGGMQTTSSSPAAEPSVSPVVVRPEPEAAKRAAYDPNKVVCKNEPVLGSRMSVKRCATVGDMAMQKFEAQQDLAKMQNRDGNHP
jgi:hypothetical protein